MFVIKVEYVLHFNDKINDNFVIRGKEKFLRCDLNDNFVIREKENVLRCDFYFEKMAISR